MLTQFYNALERPDRRARSQLAFLPAALEIQETPPSPVGRWIVWLIVLLFVIAAVWAYYGEIDIVAVAPGKVIPSDRVKVIQPLEIGVVEAIHVEEGQHVAAGEQLITLDATLSEADERRMRAELLVARIDAVRQRAFEAFLKAGRDPNTDIAWPDEVSQGQRQVQERLLSEQVNEFTAQRETLRNQLNARQAEARSIEAEITKLERTLPIISQRAASLRTLLDQRMVAESTYLELEQHRIEAEQDLATQRARSDEVQATLAGLKSQERTARAEALKRNLVDLQESERHIAVLEQEFVKAERRHSRQVLYAPIDGVVQNLSVSTVGGVVTPAEKLMTIVPANSELEVQALVLNRDIGFVEEGQAAEVKIDTFNFTKYGVVGGTIRDLSNDATSDDRLGLVYQAQIGLKQNRLRVNGKWVNLSPGMSVTVEIKTGTRRIIEFFLSPLLRYRDESIRER